ncbi:substrate-binding domain-containing protein [Streptomyces sp. NPDC057740]|uniref:substrate-binding domain-containing protein n=1 Tax=Streptomyces sp. NPDC057740 TaxID=3346234 RepID=UPI003678A321
MRRGAAGAGRRRDRAVRAHRRRHTAQAQRGNRSPAAGYTAGRQLARLADVTAVFVANEDMAIGALHAFTEAGRRVPDDISVIGYDDIPAAAHLAPPLITVRQNFTAVDPSEVP